MCVACDIPAARKCCGFKEHSANLGCSRYLQVILAIKISVGLTEIHGQSGIWLKICKALRKRNTTNSIGTLQTETGIKYSVLIDDDLPYFDPIRFTIVDPMHNLFLRTAKCVMKTLWLKNNIITGQNMNVIQARVDSFVELAEFPVK